MNHYKITLQINLHADAESEQQAIDEIKKYWQGELESLACGGASLYWNPISANKKVVSIKKLKTDFFDSKFMAL
jgi:hypothetical protein